MSVESILHYRFPAGGETLAVRLRVPRLRSLLESFYDSYRVDPRDGGKVAISLQGEEGGCYRLSGPSGHWEAADEVEAALYYESELTGALLENAGAFVHLHGAAVCWAGHCLLLVGPSGAGKSTLTLGLHLRGMSALADDALLIDPASDEVQRFDRPIRVHESSLERLGVDADDVCGARVCGPYLWLDPCAARPAGCGPRGPTAIAFLESARVTALERIAAAEALRRLLLARLSGAARRDFEPLVRLANRVPCYRLAYGEFREAVQALERLLSARPLSARHTPQSDP